MVPHTDSQAKIELVNILNARSKMPPHAARNGHARKVLPAGRVHRYIEQGIPELFANVVGINKKDHGGGDLRSGRCKSDSVNLLEPTN